MDQSLNHHQKIMSDNYRLAQAGPDSRLLDPSQPSQSGDFFITVQELHQLMKDQTPNLVIIDVTRGQGNYKLDQVRTAQDFAKGHIPGAIHLNTDELGEFKDYFIEPEAMKKVFLSKGIHHQSHVVFYSLYARDILYIASRMAYAAYYLGVDRVQILDGGLQAWERAGYPLETGADQPKAVTDFGVPVPHRPEIYIRTPKDLVDYRKTHPDSILASVRTWKEFIGANEGHAWNKGVGEIQGAVYMGDELLANELGELAHPSIYLDSLKEWGITPDKEVILYCGTSWRSSTAFFVLKQLGWDQVVMFDGSWYKYYLAHEEDPEAFPIQQGDPRK